MLGNGYGGCKECAKEKGRQTSLARYGVDHPQKSKKVRNTAKATCMAKYGVDNPSKVPQVIQKIKDTHIERYGVSSPMHVPEFVEKQQKTNRERYGVDNPMKNKAVRQKAADTCKERYGVDNPMKVKEFYDKANTSFEKKDYTLPSGTIVQLQGYEHHALDLLLLDHTEEDIKTSRDEIPVITYQFEDKTCKFYPDFYIPSEHKIIEVKSTYTYLAFEVKNKRKIEAATKQGYNIEYWIFDKHGELEQLIYTEGKIFA
jgi:hypothetical protein